MPKQMTQRALKLFIRESIQASTWYDTTEDQEHMRKALNSYYNRDKPKTTDGLSDISSQDFADMVEAVVAQIMPAFDFDEVAVFDGEGKNDVDQARHESLVCNVYVRDRNMGYTTIQEAVRNLLMLRNGILKIYAETQVRTETRRWSRVLEAEEQLMLLQPAGPRETRELVSNEDGRAAIRITTEFRRLTIECTDTTNFLLTRDFKHQDVQLAPLAGERYFETRSDLLAKGYTRSKVMKLKRTESDTRIASIARNLDGNTAMMNQTGDKSQDQIEVFELYPMVDFDGDGIAERYRIIYAGGAEQGDILEMRPAWGVPYATGTGFLQPNRWKGVDLYDKLEEIEKGKTDALRQWADNMGYMNNAEVLAKDDDANIDDLKARRPGGINRVDDTSAVVPLPVQDLSPSSERFLNYMDKVRTERGGASLDLQAAELQLAGETAHGIERQFTSKEALAQLITRTVAETLIRQTFWLVHETLRRDLPERAEVRLGNQFVVTEPGRWPYRDRITIVAGMSFAERQQRKEALGAILAQHEKLTAAGYGNGILSDLQTYHDALLDWCAASGIQHSRRYWIDPRSDESVAAQNQAAAQAQAAQQQQRELEQMVMDTQTAIQAMQEQTDRWKHMTQLEFDTFKEVLRSMIEELRIDAQSGNETSNAEPAEIDQQQRRALGG